MSKGKLSILSGYLKSRKINYLEDDNIRPTKTYIREVIFNVCEIHSDFNTLDLFCGSGILSLESISRGVNKAYLVDNNREVCKMISSEFTKLNVKNYEMFNMDVPKFVQMSPEINFDIIFIDPPYKETKINLSGGSNGTDNIDFSTGNNYGNHSYFIGINKSYL